MPISKKGSLYFTDTQYRQARACGALEYAQSRNYDLVREGNVYHLRQHDSMIFTPDGRWFWNSKKLAGRALEFIMHYEGGSLPEAVSALVDNDRHYSNPEPESQTITRRQKQFKLPLKSLSYKRLFAYLCGARGLDADIVKELVKDRRIYESVRHFKDNTTGYDMEIHNAVFVGFDSTGHPRSGYQRGLYTKSDHPFKRDVPGSDKQFAFCVPGYENTDTLVVFEASIDAISHATLAKLSGMDYKAADRIALGGVSTAPLLHYLNEHPCVKQIKLCLDNDAAGISAMEQISDTLIKEGYTTERGYRITKEPPSFCKDWNDYLLKWRALQAEEGLEGAVPPKAQEEGGEMELE